MINILETMTLCTCLHQHRVNAPVTENYIKIYPADVLRSAHTFGVELGLNRKLNSELANGRLAMV